MMKEWKVGLRFCIAAMSAVLSSGCGSDPVVYQVTVRDFLSSWCMLREDFLDLNISGIYDEGAGLKSNNVLRNETFDFFKGGEECPYTAYIDRGEISGHPDFQRSVSKVALIWLCTDPSNLRRYLDGIFSSYSNLKTKLGRTFS